MRLVCLILAAMLSASAQAADEFPKALFTRADPALRLVERTDSLQKGSSARWVGRLELTGKLVLEFQRTAGDSSQVDTLGGLHFEPDSASLKKLPVALNHYPMQPRVLEMEEEARSVLSSLLGGSAFDQLVRASAPRYEFPAVIVIRELMTSVECDRRHYMVRIASVRLASSSVHVAARAMEGGC